MAAVGWLPLVILTASAAWATTVLPAWLGMWCLALACFAGVKWLTLAAVWKQCPISTRQALSYLLLWPGMDASTFLHRHASARPGLDELSFHALQLLAGLVLLFGVVPQMAVTQPLIAGWAAMAGILLVLHFGVFQIMSWLWRRAGVDAQPIMNRPLLSRSLSEFWSRRWNLAFRDVAHTFVFRPLLPIIGPRGATLAAFLVSGLVHDLVISVPVRSGLGLPTIYFLLQGAGVLLQHVGLGKRLGLGGGAAGRVFAALLVIGPAPLLFHSAFLEQAVLPTVAALGACL
ncbi:MAG TPA: membrane bound O-acyl transferase family-domain-containing protein [Pirellulales bacterium]|jgi:hypothetical protein